MTSRIDLSVAWRNLRSASLLDTLSRKIYRLQVFDYKRPVSCMDMLKVGNIIGSYRDIRLLGAGGMGAVYEVAPLAGGKSSALKKLKKKL